MTNIIINDEYTVALLPGARAAVSTDVKSLSRPTLEIDRLASTRNLLFWGDNNDFPQSVINNVRKDPEIGTLLDKQAALLYSGGISWGIPSKVNGKVIYTDLSPNEDKVIRQWYKKSNINKYIAETAKDLYWFYNAFTEVVLDGGGTSIIQLCAQPAEECRFGPQNANSGMIDTCYLNAQWPNGTPTDPLTKKLPVLDIYYDPSQQLLANQRGLNYIYPLSIANPGNKFYQLASWNSIIESGWLDISQAIPKFKKALLKNQMTVKYHIQISNLFWDLKYPGFRDIKDMKKRKEIMLAELTAMEATLTGAERAGKSITSGLFHQENTQTAKEYELVKITPIDDLMKDGKYLEDGKDASLYKMAAIGLHPALVGTQPTNGMAGAGSNIREAYNLHVFMSKPVQDEVLSVLNNLVIPFNGWNEDMEFYFNNQLMTTLDAGKEAKATTTTSTQTKG